MASWRRVRIFAPLDPGDDRQRLGPGLVQGHLADPAQGIADGLDELPVAGPSTVEIALHGKARRPLVHDQHEALNGLVAHSRRLPLGKALYGALCRSLWHRRHSIANRLIQESEPFYNRVIRGSGRVYKGL